MCGISGFCNFAQNYLEKKPSWEEILTRMHKALYRRGNDNAGIYLAEHAGLSHARLSIRDIAGGAQPMARALTSPDTRARTCAIVYNGEIYNTD